MIFRSFIINTCVPREAPKRKIPKIIFIFQGVINKSGGSSPSPSARAFSINKNSSLRFINPLVILLPQTCLKQKIAELPGGIFEALNEV
jgi:hypothetical protein